MNKKQDIKDNCSENKDELLDIHSALRNVDILIDLLQGQRFYFITYVCIYFLEAVALKLLGGNVNKLISVIASALSGIISAKIISIYFEVETEE